MPKSVPGKVLRCFLLCLYARVFFKLQQICQVYDLHSFEQLASLHMHFADENQLGFVAAKRSVFWRAHAS